MCKMKKVSPVFEQNYDFYLGQLKTVDVKKAAENIGARFSDGETIVPFLNTSYTVSEKGVSDREGNRPDYRICIVLFKYILMNKPDALVDSEWAAYREFKDAGPLIVFFANDVEKPIANHFSGKPENLKRACEKLGGKAPDLKTTHDVSFRFQALPKAPILLLFNDADEEFPPACSVLFKKSLEKYLDMESAAILGQLISKKLIQTDKEE